MCAVCTIYADTSAAHQISTFGDKKRTEMIFYIALAALVVYILYKLEYPKGFEHVRNFDGPPLVPFIGNFLDFKDAANSSRSEYLCKNIEIVSKKYSIRICFSFLFV